MPPPLRVRIGNRFGGDQYFAEQERKRKEQELIMSLQAEGVKTGNIPPSLFGPGPDGKWSIGGSTTSWKSREERMGEQGDNSLVPKGDGTYAPRWMVKQQMANEAAQKRVETTQAGATGRAEKKTPPMTFQEKKQMEEFKKNLQDRNDMLKKANETLMDPESGEEQKAAAMKVRDIINGGGMPEFSQEESPGFMGFGKNVKTVIKEGKAGKVPKALRDRAIRELKAAGENTSEANINEIIRQMTEEEGAQ